MLKIFSYLQKKEWGLVAISIVFIVVQVWLDLKLPDYMAEITMLIQTEGTAVSDLIAPGSYMLLCAIGSMIAAMIGGYFVIFNGGDESFFNAELNYALDK